MLWFSKQFEKHGAKKVETSIHLSKNRIQVNDALNYLVHIKNIKLLFLPIINVIIIIPSSFFYIADNNNVGHQGDNNNTKSIKITTSLLSYQQVRKQFEMIAKERGYFEVKTSVTANDLLGLKTIHLIETNNQKVIVHPTPINYLFLDTIANSIQGDQLVRRWSNPDPIFYSGVREYSERDSLKDIDWKASARHNSLLVKKYDTTSDNSFMYFVLTRRGNRYEELYFNYLENVFSAISYMCGYSENNGIPYAFNTNLGMRNHSTKFNTTSLSINHLTNQLDSLACATYIPDYAPEVYLEEHIKQIDKRCTLIMFYYEVEEKDVLYLNTLVRLGYSIKLITHQPLAFNIPSVETLIFKGGDFHV